MAEDHAAKYLAEINAILDAPPALQKAPLPDCSRCLERQKTYPDWTVCKVEERVIQGRVYRQALCRACRLASTPKEAIQTPAGPHAQGCKCTDCARSPFTAPVEGPTPSLFPAGFEPPKDEK